MPETIKCPYCKNVYFDVENGKCPLCKYKIQEDLGILGPIFDTVDPYGEDE